jgi:hypothetical protein
VTIGIGFLCTDGIVLCSDRQITDPIAGFKFEERKILYHLSGDLSFVFSYAGEPDAARVMFGKLSQGLGSGIVKSKATSPREKALASLEKIFRDRNAKGLQTLIGIRFKNSGLYLYKTSNHRVIYGTREYIGVGDSSALRFLCDILLAGVLDMNEADVLGQYIIFVANRYVDGCSGGPDRTVIRKDGGISEGTGGPFFSNNRARFLYCEKEIGRALRELLFSGGTKTVSTQSVSQKSALEP